MRIPRAGRSVRLAKKQFGCQPHLFPVRTLALATFAFGPRGPAREQRSLRRPMEKKEANRGDWVKHEKILTCAGLLLGPQQRRWRTAGQRGGEAVVVAAAAAEPVAARRGVWKVVSKKN